MDEEPEWYHLPDRLCRWCSALLSDDEAPTMECYACAKIPSPEQLE